MPSFNTLLRQYGECLVSKIDYTLSSGKIEFTKKHCTTLTISARLSNFK